MVKNSFIEKTYVVGTHWNCPIQCVHTPFVTENKEANYLEVYIFQVSCPLSLPLLNIPTCQSVLKFLSLYCTLFILALQLYLQIRVHELPLCLPASCNVKINYCLSKLSKTSVYDHYQLKYIIILERHKNQLTVLCTACGECRITSIWCPKECVESKLDGQTDLHTVYSAYCCNR